MSTTGSGRQDCDILVQNGFVITMDGARTVYPAGAVAIEGRDIVAVGREREVAARYRGRRVLDAGGAPVHPGLIDAHYHVTMHLTRGAVTDDPNQRAVGGQDTGKPAIYSQWFNALTDEDEHASAMLASLEMLRNGYTCFMDPGTIFEPAAAAAAVEAVGIRATLADPFLWDLATGTQMARELERAPFGLERCLDIMGGQLWRNASPEALVQGHIAIYGSASASDELQLAAKARADEHGVPLHQHQSFTVEEVAAEDARRGRHLFVHYAEIGALGPNCTFVHMNVLRDDEVEAIAGTGISIVWHPGNFMFYGIGAHQRTRMAELYGRGVNIAFGTDIAKYWSIGEGPFLGYLVTREAGGYLPAESLFEMQTVNAARAVGLADRIGTLEVGKRADLVIRTDALADAQPGLNPVQEMVLIGRTKTVDTVIVDGQVALKDGVPTRVDQGAVHAAARASARRLTARVGLTPGTIWPMVR